VPALRQYASALIALCSSVALAQPSTDTEREANNADADEALALFREMRAGAKESANERTISVYSTHYMIGSQRFESLAELLDYMKDYPPREFSMTRLAECSARAKMEELLARKAELDRAYVEAARESGQSYFYDVGIGAPSECPW